MSNKFNQNLQITFSIYVQHILTVLRELMALLYSGPVVISSPLVRTSLKLIQEGGGFLGKAEPSNLSAHENIHFP